MSSTKETLLHFGGKGKEEEEGNRWREVVVEWDKIFRIAGPMVLMYIFNTGMSSSNEMFAGHLSSLELSAVSLAIATIGSLASAILLGLVSAQETLCGQAFGAGQARLLSVYLQRSWIILIPAAFILSPLYIFATPILKLLGQNERIADLAGRFAIRTIPQLFAVALSNPMLKFLQTQRKIAILASVGLLALVVNVALMWIFIYGFGWGFDGLAAAYNISAWVVALAQFTYIVCWLKDSWLGISWSAFTGIWSYLKTSLAAAMPLCIGAFFQVLLMLYLGRLNEAVMAIGAFSICMNITEWLTLIVSGMSAAASVRVSNELGSDRPQAAKHAIVVTSFTSLAIGAICSATILVFPNQIAALFTNDKELQKTVAENTFLLAVMLLAISLQTPLAGVAVGAGLQVLCGFVSFSASLIGFPVGILYGYYFQGGLKAIWVGLSCGMVFQLLGTSFVILRRDWKEEAARALRRMQAHVGSVR